MTTPTADAPRVVRCLAAEAAGTCVTCERPVCGHRAFVIAGRCLCPACTRIAIGGRR